MFKNKQELKVTEEAGNSTNTIAKGTVLTGDIESYGNIRIEGKIIGNIKSKSKAACGPSSQIDGNIIAQNAEIAGHVTGKVEVSELLTLKPSAVIAGDIVTNKLVVEAGATWNGGVKMSGKVKDIRIGEAPTNEPVLKAQ